MNRFYKLLILLILIISLTAAIAVLQPNKMTNIAETAVEHEDAQLKTKRYKADLQVVKNAIEEIIPTLSTYFRNWRLVNSSSDAMNNSAQIKAEVPVVIFTDDLEVKLKRESNETLVNVRSASRVGKSDLGENRRHILQLLEELDKKFAEK